MLVTHHAGLALLDLVAVVGLSHVGGHPVHPDPPAAKEGQAGRRLGQHKYSYTTLHYTTLHYTVLYNKLHITLHTIH